MQLYASVTPSGGGKITIEGNTWGGGDKKGEKTRGTRLHLTSGQVKWDAQHVHENKNMVTKATGFNFCCQGGNNGSYGCVVV